MCRCCRRGLHRLDSSEIKMVCTRCYNDMKRYWLLQHVQPETVDDEKFYIAYTDKLEENYRKGWYVPVWFEAIRKTLTN